MSGVGKPFDRDLARDATERTSRLVGVLNKYLKKFHPKLGPRKDSDVIIICKSQPDIEVFIEVEMVRADRWKKIISGEYPTVRWPLAKKIQVREVSKRGKTARSAIG